MPDSRPDASPRAPQPRYLAIAALLGAIAAPAGAQVTTNSNALDALGKAPSDTPAPAKPAAAPAHKTAPAPHHHAPPTHAKPASTAAATPSRPLPPLPPPLVSPPPPPLVIGPPVVQVPLHPPPLPPEVAMTDHAHGSAVALPDGLGTRILFDPDSAEMNYAMIDAVNRLVDRMKADPSARVEIDAFAAAASNDESAPRRQSLSRGLAIRSILIHGGIAATRIYVRALGATQTANLPGEKGVDPGSLPPDRAEAVLVRNDDAIPAAGTDPTPTATAQSTSAAKATSP